MNALKNSFEEELKTKLSVTSKSKSYFLELYQARSIFYHNIARLSHTLYSTTKITTDDIYFKNFNYKTHTYNLASEVMSQRVT